MSVDPLEMILDAARFAAATGLADELRERTAMKYACDCKCGGCQLVPRKLIDQILAALRSYAAAQEQKPHGWQWNFAGTWHTVDYQESVNPEKYARSMSDTVRPFYLSPQKPQPAPGWDEAITACKEIALNPPKPRGRGHACIATGRNIAAAIKALRSKQTDTVATVAGPPASLTYTNYRGETSVRSIVPRSVRYGSTEGHPEPQWLLLAHDTEKQADREFALKDFGQPLALDSNASVEARLREALERIASDHDCGCKPCTGQCKSEYSLRITIDAMKDEAREALSAHPDASDYASVRRDVLLTLISALDCSLGDTDPSIDSDYTYDEVKRDYPVFWVCQQLAALRGNKSEASSHEKRRLDASGEQPSTGPETSISSVRMIAQMPASARSANHDVTAGRDRQPSEPRGCPTPGACSCPEGDVSVDELADFIFDNGCLSTGDDGEEGLARAILDAHTVRRR